MRIRVAESPGNADTLEMLLLELSGHHTLTKGLKTEPRIVLMFGQE
jgi:hypothetical protein